MSRSRPNLQIIRLQKALIAQGWTGCDLCRRPMAPGTMDVHQRVVHGMSTLPNPSIKVGKETVADARD